MIDHPDESRQAPPVPGRISELIEDLISVIEVSSVIRVLEDGS